MKSTIILGLITISLTINTAFAEMKNIVCIDYDHNQESARLADIAKKYRDPNYIVHSIKRAKKFELNSKHCESASYAFKREYLLDADDLKKNTSYADVDFTFTTGCGFNVNPTKRVEMIADSSTISFFESEYYTFNIDRESLKAGKNTDRDFTCKIEDYKRNNKI